MKVKVRTSYQEYNKEELIDMLQLANDLIARLGCELERAMKKEVPEFSVGTIVFDDADYPGVITSIKNGFCFVSHHVVRGCKVAEDGWYAPDKLRCFPSRGKPGGDGGDDGNDWCDTFCRTSKALGLKEQIQMAEGRIRRIEEYPDIEKEYQEEEEECCCYCCGCGCRCDCCRDR